MQKDVLFQKLGKHVGGLLETIRLKANAAGEKFARTPYTDELFSIQDKFLFPYLERIECQALAHREWFRATAPHWAPELPLSPAEWEKMIASKSPKIAVVGYFGRSLACASWSNIHPLFGEYVAGLLAYEFTPPCIRADPALLKEYPPRVFQGFDKSLCWGVRFRISEIAEQLMKVEESWYRGGMGDDAAWMRSIIELIVRPPMDCQPPR